MLQLKHSDRQVIAEKVMELGNVTFSILVVSQVLSLPRYSLGLSLPGTIILLLSYSGAILFLRKKYDNS